MALSAFPSSSQRRGAHRVRSHCLEMHTLSSFTPSLHFDSHPTVPEHCDLPSPPDSSSPCTPSPLSCRRSRLGSYMHGVFSYDELVSSTPKRSRATSISSTKLSPILLPIGKRPAAQSTHHRPKTASTNLGVGLGLAVLASVPPPHTETTRADRARRRHAIHFHSDPQFSEALRVILDCHEELTPSDARREDEGSRTDEGSYYWETDSQADDSRHSTQRVNAYVSLQSPVPDPTAAFPSPPTSPPGFPLSSPPASSINDRRNIPLPSIPTFPDYFSELGLTDSIGDNRMTIVDPLESMARLEISMTQLEAFNPCRNGPDSGQTDELFLDAYSSLDPDNPMLSNNKSGHEEVYGNEGSEVEDETSSDEPSHDKLLPELPETVASSFAELECASFRSRSSIDLPDNGRRKRSSTCSAGLLPIFDFEPPEPAQPAVTFHPLPPRSSSLAGLCPPLRTIASSRSTPSLCVDDDSSSPTSQTMPFLFRPLRQTCMPLSSSQPSSSLSSPVRASHNSTSTTRVAPDSSCMPPMTPPREGTAQLSSFMHVTPEQPSSRVSKLWNRMGAGLRREKSARWLRGSFTVT